MAIDYGPNCRVEARVQRGVLDMSVPAARYLFGGIMGAGDRKRVKVQPVDSSTPLGPTNGVPPVNPGGLTVTAWTTVNVRSCAQRSCAVVGSMATGDVLGATCHVTGELVSNEGISNDRWVKVTLPGGEAGFVNALYLRGDETAGTPRCP